MSKTTTCTPLHASLLLNIHYSPVLWGHHRSQLAGEYVKELEAWGMCENGGTNQQRLTDKGRAWMNNMLIVPQDDQGDSEVNNQAWVPEVGEQCEYYYSEGKEWRKGEVVAFYKGAAILIDLQDGLAVNGDIVRKLNTEEDDAVDDMVSIFSALVVTIRDGLRELYRAGYRKQEAQPDLSDPANWMDGDILVCTECSNGDLKEGGKYPTLGVDSHLNLVKVIGSHGKEMWAVDSVFKFHSRP